MRHPLNIVYSFCIFKIILNECSFCAIKHYIMPTIGILLCALWLWNAFAIILLSFCVL